MPHSASAHWACLLRSWRKLGLRDAVWKYLIDKQLLERAMGIEPMSEAWEASVLPLY